MRLKRGVNVKKPSARRNIANVLIRDRLVVSFVSATDAKIVEFYNILIFLIDLFILHKYY